MSKQRRARNGIQYRIKLIAGDGTEWEWRIRDNSFKRRMAKIEREMLEVIREHDLTYEFKL